MRLKPKEVKPYRDKTLQDQGGRCLVCGGMIEPGEDVLDHDHRTGFIRGVLHRGCNSLLGKLENNHKRCGVPDLLGFLSGVSSYLQKPAHETMHPTHRTEDEKRIRRNKKAKKRREKLKGTPCSSQV